jgi:amidohydrolase
VFRIAAALLLASPSPSQQPSRLDREIDRGVAAVADSVVAWRRDIHQHPELGNRETRTAGLVADRLRGLGLEVRTGVAHTGVVAVLRGAKPGPVIALRADMDALPVTEQVDLPFASKVRTVYNGQDVGVMHACGHDTHVAMLLGVATVLAGVRRDLPGTVKFLFQPAEEGAPAGEEGGAGLMIKEGALDDPKPDAIFGLHVIPGPAGRLEVRSGATLASGDRLRIVVHGRQTHAAAPWRGVDPIVAAAQILLGLQTITSRQIDLTTGPAVVTIGSIQGGVRGNIIPDSVVMVGTIRTFDSAMQTDIRARVRRTVEGIAGAAGATADVAIDPGYPVTWNDPALTHRMEGMLRRVLGDSAVTEARPWMASEDFSKYAQIVPGMFFFLGITPRGQDPAQAAPNHSPLFFAEETAFPVGVRAMAHLAVDYLRGGPGARTGQH